MGAWSLAQQKCNPANEQPKQEEYEGAGPGSREGKEKKEKTQKCNPVHYDEPSPRQLKGQLVEERCWPVPRGMKIDTKEGKKENELGWLAHESNIRLTTNTGFSLLRQQHQTTDIVYIYKEKEQ